MKSTGYTNSFKDLAYQIFTSKIDESIFHDRLVRLSWSNPRFAVTYLWWGMQQHIAEASNIWMSLCKAVFGTCDREEMIKLNGAILIIENANPEVWKKISNDELDTQIINKDYLHKELDSIENGNVFFEKDIQKKAMAGGIIQTSNIVMCHLRSNPTDVYLLIRMHVLMGREVFRPLHEEIRKQWYLAKCNGVHNPGDQPTPENIDDVIKHGPREAGGVPDGKIKVSTDAPTEETIAGFASERRMQVKRYKALGEAIDLKEPALTPDELRDQLTIEFPWMGQTINVIHRDMTVRRSFGQSAFLMPPLLLVGPAGTGKTRFTMRLAELVGVPYSALSLTGAADDRMLQGTGSGWSNAQPAYPVVKMNDTKCANLMILLDEIDKVSADGRNGNPHASLLSMIEPESARNYHDDALMMHINISMVNWIATANSTAKMPMPLLSRFRVIEVPAPSSKDVVAIIRGVRTDFAQEVGCDVRFVPYLDEAEIMYLEREFGKRPNVRVLIRMVERLIVRRETLDRQQPH